MKYLAHGLIVIALAGGLVSLTRAGQNPKPANRGHAAQAWEYHVAGLTDIHESTLDYLKGALGDEGGLLGKAKAADEQLAKKTEDLLNELGADGWDLVHFTNTSIILKRPAR